MIDRHLRPETYATATAVLVDAQQGHPFAAIWGDGHVSSSDGQFFPAGGRGEASLDYNAKYGKRPGASLCGFALRLPLRLPLQPVRLLLLAVDPGVRERSALCAKARSSTTKARSRSTSTRPGTAGATETVFAMFHLFGTRLIPRIRNLGGRRLFGIDPDDTHDPQGALIGGTVNMRAIEPHWDAVLRLAASIGAGLVPPSVILKRIAATPRQNGLSVAARARSGGPYAPSSSAAGCSIPSCAKRSHAILNKGESRHALARAVFLHQLGELRNRIAGTMAYRASGLNLVVNAIILWNTVYLSRAVRFVHDQGNPYPRCASGPGRPAAPKPYRAHRRLPLERD